MRSSSSTSPESSADSVALEPEPAAHEALHAGDAELLVQDQELHAALVERRQHVVEAAGAALAELVQRLELALALELLDERPGGPEHLVGLRALDVDLDAAGEPLAQVVVQLLLEVGRDLARAADDQALEGLLEVAQQRVAGDLQVVVLLLLDPTLVACRPAPWSCWPDTSSWICSTSRSPSGEPRKILASRRFTSVRHQRLAREPGQRPHQRRVSDGDAVRHAAGQLQGLEQPTGSLAKTARPWAPSLGRSFSRKPAALQ